MSGFSNMWRWVALVALVIATSQAQAAIDNDLVVGYAIEGAPGAEQKADLGPGARNIFAFRNGNENVIANDNAASQSYSSLVYRPEGTNGTDNEAGANINGSLSQSFAEQTFVAWIRRDSSDTGTNLTSTHRNVFAIQDGNLVNTTGDQIWWLEDTNRRFRWNFYHSGGSSEGIGADVSIPLDEWTHVATVYDNGVSSVLINGVPVTTVAAGTPNPGTAIPAASGGELSIGYAFNVASSLLGQIDEVALFSRALQPWEVQSIMNVGIEAFPEPASGMMLIFAGAGLLRRRR